MGVAGLWEVLKPAAKTRSLTELAVKEGFQANPDSKRGFRIGIDASIWFFHAEYGREGENPVLRTLFFRCATLMRTTFLPLFVFDGPKRPEMKRGKKVARTPHKLIPGMKQIVEAFGFEWRMAPGEAEAELAYLNRIGVIDGVLSDDVDNFLFGAVTVVRNASNTLSGNKAHPTLNSAGKDDKNHTRVFRIQDIEAHPDVRLTRGGMILIGLMRGGDYHPEGVTGCGVTTAHALAKCGFGDSLLEAAWTLDRESLEDFVVQWRHDLCQELRTNSKGFIGRKQVALAKSITEDFPDIDILLSYACPITSESMGRAHTNLQLTWNKEPDLSALAGVCEFYFEWGYKEAIIKRFRTVMWHSVIVRILRRAVLDKDEEEDRRLLVPATPSRKGKTMKNCGTPSKMIAKHFSSLALESPQKVYVSGSEDEDEDEKEGLIVTIHSSRTHTSTDGLLEYRLEIAPKQLVELTAAGIKGIRVPEGPDEWASEEDEEGKKAKGPVDPESHLRVWMPACMVEIVEPELVKEFEDKEAVKREKKAKKGTRARKKAGEDEDDGAEAGTAKPKAKTTRKPAKKAVAPRVELDDDMFDEDDVDALPVLPAAKKATKPAARPKKAAAPVSEDEDDVFSSPVVPKPKKAPVAASRSKKAPEPPSNPSVEDIFSSPVAEKPKKATKAAKAPPPPARKAITVELSEDEAFNYDDVEMILRARAAASKRNPPAPPRVASGSSHYADDLEDDAPWAKPVAGSSSAKASEEFVFSSSPISTRTGVKDLTKKKKPAQSSTLLDLKSYYSVAKSTAPVIQAKADNFSRPSYQSSQSSQSSSSTLGYSSSSQTRVASSSEPDYPPKEKTALLSGLRAPSMRFDSLDISDHEDRLAKEPSPAPAFKLHGAVPPSPSKRKNVQRKIVSSDSEASAHVHKSPRKKVIHTSPKRPQRPEAAQARITQYLASEVIEITDSDDDDDDAPSPPLLTLTQRSTSASTTTSTSTSTSSSSNLNPLSLARARKGLSQPASKPAPLMKQRKKVPPIMPINPEDVIDLT